MSQNAKERIPIEPGYFTIPDDVVEAPRLLGSRCQSCGEYFFPRRPVCAKCCHRGTDDVELSPHGTLFTYTYIHVPLFNSQRATDGGRQGSINNAQCTHPHTVGGRGALGGARCWWRRRWRRWWRRRVCVPTLERLPVDLRCLQRAAQNWRKVGL